VQRSGDGTTRRSGRIRNRCISSATAFLSSLTLCQMGPAYLHFCGTESPFVSPCFIRCYRVG
jgi:hypothetical protein